jgi:2-polyprenyl-6-hydroxyphenyl methylase/3-demethylubiquinone-9 3-methyltransferase
VQGYLKAEIDFILGSVTPGLRVLELGCGYGRVLAALVPSGAWLVGIDLSLSSLALAKHERRPGPVASLLQMDASALGFRPESFDLVCCPQNGISALHVDQQRLIGATLRLLRPGGRALFFSYADAFWRHRLAWFRIQAAHGLIGEIDESATGRGTIVCKDGFTATTVSPDRFEELTRGLDAEVTVSILRGSSVVCSLTKRSEG